MHWFDEKCVYFMKLNILFKRTYIDIQANYFQ